MVQFDFKILFLVSLFLYLVCLIINVMLSRALRAGQLEMKKADPSMNLKYRVLFPGKAPLVSNDELIERWNYIN